MDILHLRRTDGCRNLQARVSCFLQSLPGHADAFRIEFYRNRQTAVPDGGSDRLDPQGIDLGLLDPLCFDHCHAETVEELCHLQLFLKRQGNLFFISRLFHCHVTDTDLSHISIPFLLKLPSLSGHVYMDLTHPLRTASSAR